MLFNSPGRQGYYGVENPIIPTVQAFIALMMLQLGQRQLDDGESDAWWLVGSGTILLSIALLYLHASRRGRFRAWSRALGELELSGRETVLDVGCARGAVTTLAAARLPEGQVVGVDTWGTAGVMVSKRHGSDDQIARSNASREGVAERITYVTGEPDDLVSEGNHFDVVVSGGGIGRLRSPQRREAAVDEAVRVLKPGGRLLISDIRNTGTYASRLRELGCEDVRASSAGWESWYGGPWLPLTFVSARKPAS